MKLVRTATVLLTAAAASAALSTQAPTASAATVTHLSASCTNSTASAMLRHSGTTGAYWGTGTLNCSQTYQFTVFLKENGNTLSSTHFGRYGANNTRSGAAPSFTPKANASYQVVVTVADSRGSSLGYMTSGAPIVLRSNPYDTAKAEGAIRWMNARRGSSSYNGYCEKTVENAFGVTGKFASARADWNSSGEARHSDWRNAPRGTLVFYSTSANAHVAISLGDGNVISTSGRNGGIDIVPIGYFQNPLGWKASPWR